MATPPGRRLGYHTPEQVSNQEPPDSRPCALTTTLLGGVYVLAISSTNTVWLRKYASSHMHPMCVRARVYVYTCGCTTGCRYCGTLCALRRSHGRRRGRAPTPLGGGRTEGVARASPESTEGRRGLRRVAEAPEAPEAPEALKNAESRESLYSDFKS